MGMAVAVVGKDGLRSSAAVPSLRMAAGWVRTGSAAIQRRSHLQSPVEAVSLMQDVHAPTRSKLG
jgi:hypothetical protein